MALSTAGFALFVMGSALVYGPTVLKADTKAAKLFNKLAVSVYKNEILQPLNRDLGEPYKGFTVKPVVAKP